MLLTIFLLGTILILHITSFQQELYSFFTKIDASRCVAWQMKTERYGIADMDRDLFHQQPLLTHIIITTAAILDTSCRIFHLHVLEYQC